MGGRCWFSNKRLAVLLMLFFSFVSSSFSFSSDDSSVIQRLTVRLEETTNQTDNCTFFKQIENVLTATSQQLHNVTKGRLQWDRIAILVPKSAASLPCFRLADQQQQKRHNNNNNNNNKMMMNIQQQQQQQQPKLVIKTKRGDSISRMMKSPDLVIHSGSHPLLADLPYARQFGGCGQPGLGVHLTRPFVRSFNAHNAFLSGRQVLREWVKDRYGVFEETGFVGDLQYPVWTSEYGSHPPVYLTNSSALLQENSCSTASTNDNGHHHHHSSSLVEEGEEGHKEEEEEEEQEEEGEFRVLMGGGQEDRNATLFDTQSTIRPSANATAEREDTNATKTTKTTKTNQSMTSTIRKVKASIMATLDAEDWCDGSTHIRWMPTKQNVLCEERSLWQVMENHADFQKRPSSETNQNNYDPLETTVWPDSTESPTLQNHQLQLQHPHQLQLHQQHHQQLQQEWTFFPPEFEYILPTVGRRYVVVLDRSSSSRRWSLIRRALYRWIHALPASRTADKNDQDDRETYLSVVVSNGGQESLLTTDASSSSVVLGWTKVTADNRDGLVGRIPRRPLLIAGGRPSLSSSSSSLDSAVQLAHQMLVDEKESTCCGGQMILLTGSSIDVDLDAMSDQVVVHTIAFPSRSALIDLHQQLPSSPSSSFDKSGLQLAVDDWTLDNADDGQEEETSLTQSRLVAAFLQILRYDRPDTPTQVYEETVTNRPTSGQQQQQQVNGVRRDGTTSGTFHLDAPLGDNVRVVAHVADEADLDTIQVVSPSGKVYDLPLVSDGMLHIRIAQTDEFGEWSYRLRFAPVASSSRHPTALQAATLEVTAQPSPSSSADREVITVVAWTNVGRQPVNASTTPILIYAQVNKGSSPVVDAKVTALIHPPNRDNTTYGPFLVQLYDRGTGDPDITRADGIYSAYFTKAIEQPGHYSVTIQVTDNGGKASIPIRRPGSIQLDSCCGSSLPYDQTVAVQPFRRLISGPSFVTSDGPDEDQDVYPPGRISDLRVERIANVTNQVELGWTAPGTDYDSGSAAFYQIRCYTDRSALNDSSSAILVHASLTPQPLPAGTWQKAMVAVPWPNQIFYYAIVAVDFSGLRGKVSNIVPVYIEEPPPPPTTTTTAVASPSSLPSDFPVNVTQPEAAVQALTEQQLYAIAGGVAGFILLLVILSIAACLSRRKRDDGQEKPKSSQSMKIQVEPLTKIHGQSTHHQSVADCGHSKEQEAAAVKSSEESRPVYKIYVNNAYIQEEDGELKIVTPDGRIIQRGSPWFSSATLPRGRSLTNLEGLEAGTSATDLHHWSLPRAKTSPHRHKVLTNGSIMPTSGSQSVININNPSCSNVGHGGGGGAIADGTSISSKPSVSSDDTGIEVSDHQTDSRDSADLQMILPPPGFGPIQHQQLQCNGYLPMYANHNLLPPLPPSPGMSQDARVVRIPSFLNPPGGENHSSGSWLGDFNDSNFCSQPSSRRPLMIGSYGAGGSEDRTPQISPPPPSTPTSQSSVVHHQPRRKTRHISFV